MATQAIDDRETTRRRPWFLRHTVDRRDRQSQWSLVRQGKRDGAKGIPTVPADASGDVPFSNEELLSIGTFARVHAVGTARVNEMGMEWRADEARLVTCATEAAGEIRAIEARIAELQRQASEFDKKNPEIESPQAANKPAEQAADELLDGGGGYNAEDARIQKRLAAHAASVRDREAQRRNIDEALLAAVEELARSPFRLRAVFEELITAHDLCCRDADRHRQFSAELASMYWSANQMARRVWWRRIISRLGKRNLPTLPAFKSVPIPESSWETDDPTRGLSTLSAILEKAN